MFDGIDRITPDTSVVLHPVLVELYSHWQEYGFSGRHDLDRYVEKILADCLSTRSSELMESRDDVGLTGIESVEQLLKRYPVE